VAPLPLATVDVAAGQAATRWPVAGQRGNLAVTSGAAAVQPAVTLDYASDLINPAGGLAVNGVSGL
jgi:hypothetical protein